jgi:hypothetical protein
MLSEQLDGSRLFSNYRILAVTHSSKSLVAQELTQLPHLEVAQYSWPETTPAWFREHVHCVTQGAHSIAEESSFHHAAFRAGVKYVVHITTTAVNVRPDCDAYYQRAHWAIEAMSRTSEFKNLHWTSLQPNVFLLLYLYPAAELINRSRNGEKQETLLLTPRSTPKKSASSQHIFYCKRIPPRTTRPSLSSMDQNILQAAIL